MTDFRDPIQKAIEEAIKPISKLVDKVAGPAAKEIGLTLGEGVGIIRDNVREYRQKRGIFRYARQLDLWKTVGCMIEEADFQPRPVAPRLLFAAVEAASNEGDDDLQEHWAALIANAADPRRSTPVHAYFPDLLSQLTGEQARYLAYLYKDERPRKPGGSTLILFQSYHDLLTQYAGAGLTHSDFELLSARIFGSLEWETKFAHTFAENKESVDADLSNFEIAVENLLRLSLIGERTYSPEERFRVYGSVGEAPSTSTKKPNESLFLLTETGRRFVEACTRPHSNKRDGRARSRKGPTIR